MLRLFLPFLGLRPRVGSASASASGSLSGSGSGSPTKILCSLSWMGLGVNLHHGMIRGLRTDLGSSLGKGATQPWKKVANNARHRGRTMINFISRTGLRPGFFFKLKMPVVDCTASPSSLRRIHFSSKSQPVNYTQERNSIVCIPRRQLRSHTTIHPYYFLVPIGNDKYVFKYFFLLSISTYKLVKYALLKKANNQPI